MSILSASRIRLQSSASDKTDAIRQAGELLVKSGCVTPEYVDGMLSRESTMSTYLGSGVAIPHGEYENRDHILSTGVSVLQLSDGVEWEPGEKVQLVFGIAASSDEHVGVLAQLANVVEDEQVLDTLKKTSDPQVFIDHLTGQE
jgi:phosphocarrier protein FPr